MLKFCPKYFQEFHKIFTDYAHSVFQLYLHYAPKLATFVTIIIEHLINECSIRVFHYKVTVLLESIDLRSYDVC